MFHQGSDHAVSISKLQKHLARASLSKYPGSRSPLRDTRGLCAYLRC